MSDEERLARLVSELGSDPRYATGSRRFPLHIAKDEAIAIAQALAEEFDTAASARAAQAQRQGLHIYCKAGCSACCEVMVMVYRPEALAIAQWLGQPENHAVRERFLAAYPAWRAAVGQTPERLTQLFASGQQEGYDALHLQQWRQRTLCAFNHEGSCSIYPVRPLACRNAHALDTDANCPASAPAPPAAVSFLPLERFLKDATRVLRAAHNATTPRRHEQQSVCAFVHSILGERPAARR
jgi:Fe-S-cluster containining protein